MRKDFCEKEKVMMQLLYHMTLFFVGLSNIHTKKKKLVSIVLIEKLWE